ncbi:MAG: lysophospholipid acyltransferase family protein [Gammaproteobacteria bacterium]|nr:MAG: lysophospholipid acyltransferase family protein [Gammaproteobacteria bacterium]
MASKTFLIPPWLAQKIPALRKAGWYLEAGVVRLLARLMAAMPPERAAGFANSVFRNLRPVLPFAAKIRRNLGLAFPEKDRRELDRLTRSACGNFGNAAAELVLAKRIWDEREQRIEFVVAEGVNLADYRGRPAIMVTGHIGAWQISTFLATQYELPVTSVYAPEENPYLRALVLRLRSTLGCRFISRDGCMRGLTQELKRGNMVGLVSDTRLDSGDTIPFFGVPTPSNTTAARLALRHNCDFFPVRAERLPGMRFRITLFPAIRPADADASVAEQAQQMTSRLFEYFEVWIRENPDQWMCFGRRWPHEAYAAVPPGKNDRG